MSIVEKVCPTCRGEGVIRVSPGDPPPPAHTHAVYKGFHENCERCRMERVGKTPAAMTGAADRLEEAMG
jgi:hypothetical protein